MHLLITGVSGFLGRHVADLARERGHFVTAIVRVGDKRRYDGVNVIERDLTGEASLFDDLKSVDAVIHCAADTNVSPRKIRDAWAFNVAGTEKLLRESKAAGSKRFIYVSTAATLAPGESPGLPYIQSKIESEKLLLREFQHTNFPIIIINPAFILGPGDERSGSTRLIKLFAGNRIIVHTRGAKNIVDVRDVAAAVLNAVTMGKAGHRYLLVNESISYRGIIEVVDRCLNRASFKVQMPDLFWQLIGYSGTALSFMRTKGFPINHLTVDLAVGSVDYSLNGAKDDLHFYPRPAEDTIIDTVKWIKHRQ